ncbi:MAG: branched-chain amino acid ABC transporter permease [Ignavibacteriae bacterium]|nr:branched-chain amino acid ABC transporter permease [Ignavibacteriota bacterium]
MKLIMQIIINIFISSLIYLFLADGFFIIYYPSKFFPFSHAIIITLGAYFTYLLSNQVCLPLWVAILSSVTLATMLGIFIEKVIYRPLRKHCTSLINLMITSLGLYIVLQNVISIFWSDDTRSIRKSEVSVGNEFFGAYITDTQVAIIISSMVIFISILIFMKYTKIGKSIHAISSNAELCNIFGINSENIVLWATGIGSALAATAGILISLDVDMTPTMGFNLLLYGVVAMIIGGVGSIRGLVFGAVLLATAQHLTAYYIDSKWMDAITYLILIIFLLWKPLGFSGKRLKKVEI